MEELKPWWTSKAIWTGLIGSAWGVAGTLGLLPEGLSQADVLTVVLAIKAAAIGMAAGASILNRNRGERVVNLARHAGRPCCPHHCPR